MSFLTPLYVLGLLAVAAPVVFHLIRRAPKGEVPFSSLMFLTTTPPRLTRRSRLDNILLLIVRAAALCLLAFAFARPFFRQAARLDPGGAGRRRVALLIDTSASLRRGDLWRRARGLADAAVAAARPGDEVAVFAFDATTRTLMGFAESATLDPARRQAVARAAVARLEPTWAAADLGRALVETVAAVEDVSDAGEAAGRMPRRVVLVGDLAQGSRLDALGDFAWPKDVELEIQSVTDDGSNAGLQRLADADPAEASSSPPAAADQTLRVRVANEPTSRRETFTLAWVDAKGAESGPRVEVYVPPGQSRVARVPRPTDPGGRLSLRLQGDAHPFDNTVYFAPEPRDDLTVAYLGGDAADDPAGLRFYLERVFAGTSRRAVTVVARPAGDPLALRPVRSMPLVVLASGTTASNVKGLRAYLAEGGTVVAVVAGPGRAESAAGLAGVEVFEALESPSGRDVMLGEIAFDHPLFSPLAGAQFNDFTKIRFWKHRRIPPDALGKDARVVARFEDGDPAVVEKRVGKGRLVVFTTGWTPADGQLARSSKFVPLMASLLEGNLPRATDSAGYRVNDSIPLPQAGGDTGSSPQTVRKPDGTVAEVTPGSAAFEAADQPGVYTVQGGGAERAFAVNLDPSESRTSPLNVETLEQFGCKIAGRDAAPADRDNLRQLQNVELEGRQKLWRWLVLAAITVLIVETWLAARLGSRHRPARAETQTT